MAITLLGNPPTIAPAYNPMYFQVSSDKTAQEAFNFLFDVYVNGVFVNRDRLLPRPATTQAIYSPARMLESYVSYDLTQNIVDETASVNSIDKYKVIFGEEYIVYWNYTGLVKDTITLTSYTIVSSVPGNPHGYSIGDDILIAQDLPFTYAKYNGVHKVVDVLDENNILINVNWTDPGTILYEPGRTTWADKRKTVFISNETILTNGTDYSLLTEWSFFGPDGCAVEAGIFIDNTITLNVPDVSCGSALQVVTYNPALIYNFIPGRTYTVTYTITANDPSGEGWNVYSDIGGTSVVHNVDGTYTDTIICGGDTTGLKFGLNLTNADTGGFGAHNLKVSDLTVELLPESFEAYDFNAVLQYEEVPTWSSATYDLTSSTSKFLTKQPNSLKCSLTDRGSIAVLNKEPIGSIKFLYVSLTSGIFITVYPLPIPTIGTASSTNEYIMTLPAFPWNINQWSQTVYAADIIDSSISQYTINIGLWDGTPLSESITFVIDDCTKYEPVRFMFLNSLGQFDYYSATLLSRTTLNTSRDSFVKTLSMGYTQGDRGKTVINVNSQESYSVNTNWISESTAQWLSYELFNSSEVYILDNTDGSITPVIIDNQSIEPKKRVNDSLINYQFNYSKAVPLNTQRN